MSKPVRVLLVEDNPGDAELIRDSLAAGQLSLEIAVAVDGANAVEYSFRNGAYASVEAPDSIVLDLTVRAIEAFWTTVVKLPGRRENA